MHKGWIRYYEFFLGFLPASLHPPPHCRDLHAKIPVLRLHPRRTNFRPLHLPLGLSRSPERTQGPVLIYILFSSPVVSLSVKVENQNIGQNNNIITNP